MRPHILALAALFVLATACTYSNNDINVGQGQGITNPTASPSPEPQCAIRSLGLGTAGDATTVTPGSAVTLVLSVIGQQGLELSSSCLASVSPNYEASGPCLLEGGGFNASLRAPAGTVLGSTCKARALIGAQSSNYVNLTVVQ